MPSHWAQPAAQHCYRVFADRNAIVCRRWDAPRRAATSTDFREPLPGQVQQRRLPGQWQRLRITAQFKEVRFHGDEVVYVSIGDGATSRRRVLGGHEHGLQRQAAGAVPDRGQRLRDLRAGGGADGGRQYLAAGRQFSALPLCRVRRHRRDRKLRRDARGGGAHTRRQGTGFCPWPCDSPLLALAFRR